MVAASARHMHQKHLRGASRENDDPLFQEKPRSISGGGSCLLHDQPTPPNSLSHSTAVLTALEDSDSELARFLLCDNNNNNGDGGKKMQSIGSINAAFYTLALEPLEIRNERVIMLFESYALFGALFMNAVWIIYEWGNANEDGGSNPNVNRAFECIMAIALCSNIFLALYGVFCWMLSCMVDSSNQDFVFESRTMLSILHYLLIFTTQLVQFGLFIGIWKNLSPNLPETIFTLSIAILFKVVGETLFSRHLATCVALEFWHFPLWLQAMSGPFYFSGREKLRTRAKLRAQKLRKRAYQERQKLDPKFREGGNASEYNASSVGALLRTAAINLGRNDLDISNYEARLEEDLFNEAVQLKGRSVECLSRYMPLRLAEEVHTIVGTKEDAS